MTITIPKKPCKYWKVCPYFRRSECDNNKEEVRLCIHYDKFLININQGKKNENLRNKKKRSR